MSELQRIFDKVSRHLLMQKQKSKDPVGHCAYRGGYGLKCAIGCLITDDNYSDEFEGTSIHRARIQQAVAASGFNLFCGDEVEESRKISLLMELQQIHDLYDVENWESKLRSVAFSFGLRTTKLDKLSTVM